MTALRIQILHLYEGHNATVQKMINSHKTIKIIHLLVVN